MAPTMICKGFVAMAAIRSCGGAFIANAPRPVGIGIGSSTLRNYRADSTRSSHAASRSRSALSVVSVSHRDASSLDASSSSQGHYTNAPRRSGSSESATTPLRPLVVCGPSGVGKGTIISRFMEDETKQQSGLPKFGFSVSHTTRQPRPGEVDGTHYHFVTREFMLEKIASGSFFIEHAEVHGNMYGTSFQSIFDVSNVASGGSDINCQCLLDIDVEGVKSIKEFQYKQHDEIEVKPTLGKDRSTQQYVMSENNDAMPRLDAKFVFIAPPSVDVLRERLAGRGTETPETLERRFRNAKAELEYGMVPGNFDAIVVNDDLDRACEEFESAVEKMYID